ncbi:MAG: hypothetical protein WCY21_06940 [Candidatus Cloacimonadaceae bacterium]|jgi:hypothetical protein|nr:hypothetical protein [Candidatus Cloacimonadota bacterium]MDX9950120.1 hypothetical protein [Candidatus Syntrophosphaera sp.]
MKAWILVFCFCIVVGSSFAQFAGGSGTESDPWQVATAEHLDNVRSYLGSSHSNKYFIQTADINLGEAPWNMGEGWIPIGGHSQSFRGNFNGNQHIIMGLTIKKGYYTALFGGIEGATISNLGLENVNVHGGQGSAALIGDCRSSIVDNCYCTGIVKGEAGLIADMYNSYLFNSYVDCELINYSRTLGLVGSISSSTVRNSFYNYDTVLVDGEKVMSIGALPNDMFTSWLNNG